MAARQRDRPPKDDSSTGENGLVTPRALLIILVAVGTGVGLALAGQPWLAVPVSVGVLCSLHATIGR